MGKFSRASWAKDGSGFYYSRYSPPKEGGALTGLNEFQKLYFHKLGTPQSDDVLVYERRDHKDWGFHGEVTEDGRYLVITITKGTDPKLRVHYRDLADAAGKVIPLLDDFDADYDFIANDGPVFFFKTDLEAPRSRVIAIDVTKPGRANWREIISQSEDVLRGVHFVNEQFICNYLHDAHSRVRILAWDGESPRAKLVREGGEAIVLQGIEEGNGGRYLRTTSDKRMRLVPAVMQGSFILRHPPDEPHGIQAQRRRGESGAEG